MGLLDPEYTNRRPPSWDEQGFHPYWDKAPANDPIHPWTGLLGLERETLNSAPLPELPPEDEHELEGFAHRLPPPRDFDRAYNPTLRYEDSVPGILEAQREERAAIDAWARRDADARFSQPKTRDEAGLGPLTTPEKLEIILRHYFPGLMGGD